MCIGFLARASYAITRDASTNTDRPLNLLVRARAAESASAASATAGEPLHGQWVLQPCAAWITSSTFLTSGSGRAAALLQALEEPCGARVGVALRLHPRQKGEDGRTQVGALLDAARASADAPVVGVLPKARAAEQRKEKLRESDFGGQLAHAVLGGCVRQQACAVHGSAAGAACARSSCQTISERRF